MNTQSKMYHGILILISGIILLSTTGWAQPGQHRPPMLPDSSRIVEMVNELAVAISMTDEQKAQVSTLFFAHFKEAKKVIQNNKNDREKGREAMDQLHKKLEDQVKTVLSEEQQVQYDTFLKKHRLRPGRKR